MTDIQKQLAEVLIDAGSRLANIAFNLKYRPGQAHRDALADAQKAWDAALAAHRQQEARKPLTEEQIEAAARDIAVRVAQNCGSVPNLTFPDIYLGLKEIIEGSRKC